jgi:hypothetical protein
MTKARIAYAIPLVAALAVLTACAAGVNDAPNVGTSQAGFWLGLWQGLISPITFLVSLFTREVNVYEVHNNGNWYDFGFMLGVATAFSGAGRGQAAIPRRKAARKQS